MRAKTSIGRGFTWSYADNRYVGERDGAAASPLTSASRKELTSRA
jgi:hypothetical protein